MKKDKKPNEYLEGIVFGLEVGSFILAGFFLHINIFAFLLFSLIAGVLAIIAGKLIKIQAIYDYKKRMEKN